MAYNFSLKKYANGTCQLTYYDFPVLDSFDKNIFQYSDADPPCTYLEECRTYDDENNYTPWGYVDFLEDNPGVNQNHMDNIVLSEEELEERRKHSVSTSLTRSIHRLYDYGRNNVWEWFFTFTLSETTVQDRCDYKECSKIVTTWMNNIKRKYSDLKYLIVPERHPTSGAWHYHALVSNIDAKEFVIAKNNKQYRTDQYGDVIQNEKGEPVPNKYFGKDLRTSYPNGDYIYNIKSYKGGFSTATAIKNTKKAVSYIMKYMTKELAESTFGCRRFYPSNNLNLPEREVRLLEKVSLQEIITQIESTYNVKLSADYIKSVTINSSSYKNTVSYLEFE